MEQISIFNGYLKRRVFGAKLFELRQRKALSCNLIYRTPRGSFYDPNRPYLVEAKLTRYLNVTQVFVPKNPYGKQLEADSLKHKGHTGFNSESNKDRSLRRTVKTIKDIVLCNPFEWFVTLTFKSDRKNLPKLFQQMKDWLKNQTKRNGKFLYLIVPEYHKDGALHFHALFKNYTGKIVEGFNPLTGKQLKEKHTLAGYKLGFSNARRIKQKAEDQGRVATYLSKYITKDLIVAQGKKRYWASTGLERPQIQYNPEKWYETTQAIWSVNTEYGRIMVFANDDIPTLGGKVI
jgi:hypothetical protein